MIHTVECLRAVSSHCSSLPPCSEMMFQQVTFACSLCFHFNMHVRRDSARQFCAAGSALPAMADKKDPSRPWKRSVVPVLTPDWMTASVVRMEEAREETLDSARKRQRDTPREGDEEMPAAEASAPAASSGTGQPTELPSSASLPPPVSEDMRNFRYASMTPASFQPTRHLFMCAGRPMVVACFMYSPTPPSFQVSVMLPRKRHSIIPWYGIVLGRFQCSCFSDPCVIRTFFPIL